MLHGRVYDARLAIAGTKASRSGVFIINTQLHPTTAIYVKVTLSVSTSVLMAEAAAPRSSLHLASRTCFF